MVESTHKKLIFVVDDEPANLKLIHRVLKHNDQLELMLIRNPHHVLPHYRRRRPDLILLDLNMPGLSGYEVMAQLQNLEDPLLPPMVILTAQHSSKYLLKALMMGARDFIPKPFDRTELIMRVNNLLDSHLAHRLVHEQKIVLEEMVLERTEEVRRTQLQIVRRLGMAAEYRDEETGYHILRMSHVCALLAKSFGCDRQQVELILNASPMHDIGKIGIPDNILLKKGKLNSQEWKIMQSHTIIGKNLLDGDDSPLLTMARDIAGTHHEKWDGNGYPEGLKNDAIPLPGRIAALADVFDALTSERPYKVAWPIKKAVAYIKENSGKYFDPQLVDTFMGNLPEILQIREQFSENFDPQSRNTSAAK